MRACETCGEKVLEARVEGRTMMVHPEAFTGIRLDQKFPEQVHYVSGKVARFFVLHECKASQESTGESTGEEVSNGVR